MRRRVMGVLMAAVLATGCFIGLPTQVKAQEEELEGSFTYWMHNGTAFVDATEDIVNEFMELHPKVKINLQKFPYDVLMEKVSSAYAAGNEADLIQAYGSWLQPLIKNDQLESVPESLLEEEQDVYYETALKGFEKDGKYYGLPREVNIEYGLFYYKDDLEAAGAEEIPDNFEDFLELAKKMTVKDSNGNIMKAGFDFYDWDNSMTLFFAWILQQGGSYFQEDGVHINFTSPEATRAFQLMVDMASGEEAVTDIKRITEQNTIQNLFFQKRSASMTKGAWACALGDEAGINREDYVYTVVPPLEGEASICASESGWGEIVSAKSEKKELVWEFLKFATNKENSAKFNTITGTLPARIDVAEDEAFQNDPANVQIKDAYKLLETAQPMGIFADGDYIRDSFQKYLPRAIKGEVTVEKALSDMQEDVNKHFDDVLQ